MVTTRSANKQSHLEDFTEQGKPAPSKPQKGKTSKGSPAKRQSRISASKDGGMLSPPPSPTRKRKGPPSDVKRGSQKKVKKEEPDEDPVIINRAPVLHLWGAAVTHFLYPKLNWSTCLSAGSAISTICAIAKGRSIGTIDEPEDTEERRKKKEKEKEYMQDHEVLEVMQFKLKQKDGKVYFGGKPQSSNEETLRKKYGDRYDEVKEVLEEALKEWKDDEEELSKAAFGMYEDFRPNIAAGQKGWGRKGALDLNIVRKTIGKR
jgi:hypothetical protein